MPRGTTEKVAVFEIIGWCAVSTGNGDAAGLNKVTGDLTKMAAQVPALFETLSGMDIRELLGKVRQIGDKTEKPAQNGGK